MRLARAGTFLARGGCRGGGGRVWPGSLTTTNARRSTSCPVPLLRAVVDAKHVLQHLDETKPEGVENESVEQASGPAASFPRSLNVSPLGLHHHALFCAVAAA